MLDEYRSYLEEAKNNKKAYKKKVQQIKNLKEGELDKIIHQAHDESFDCIDCLKCANCCKTTGPLFTQKDIERIAKYLKLKPGDFIEQYLKIDEEQDYILQSTPCTFLGSDNYCSIYEVRPKACAEYPHTDMRNQKKILNLTLKNTEICPAVALTFKQINEEL